MNPVNTLRSRRAQPSPAHIFDHRILRSNKCSVVCYRPVETGTPFALRQDTQRNRRKDLYLSAWGNFLSFLRPVRSWLKLIKRAFRRLGRKGLELSSSWWENLD